jgi:hypothetical protein
VVAVAAVGGVEAAGALAEALVVAAAE